MKNIPVSSSSEDLFWKTRRRLGVEVEDSRIEEGAGESTSEDLGGGLGW